MESNKSKVELLALLFATCYSVSESYQVEFSIKRIMDPNSIYIQIGDKTLITVNLNHSDLPSHIAKVNAMLHSINQKKQL